MSERGSERSQWGACVARWPGTPGPPWCGRWWWSRTDWSCTGPACCWCLYNWLHCSRTIDHPTGGQETIPSQGGIDTTTHNYQQQILLTAVERFVTGLVRDFFCWFRSESKKWLDALVIGIPLPSIQFWTNLGQELRECSSMISAKAETPIPLIGWWNT